MIIWWRFKRFFSGLSLSQFIQFQFWFRQTHRTFFTTLESSRWLNDAIQIRAENVECLVFANSINYWHVNLIFYSYDWISLTQNRTPHLPMIEKRMSMRKLNFHVSFCTNHDFYFEKTFILSSSHRVVGKWKVSTHFCEKFLS